MFEREEVTKRTISKMVACIFDPLEFVYPFVLKVKTICKSYGEWN